MLIALSKHLALTNDKALVERCKLGLILAVEYLFDGIWDSSENTRRLTVCANEWEESEEPHLRGPLFSSVVGLLYSASLCTQRVLQEYVDLREIDLKEYEKQTQSMLMGFFMRGGVIRMIKRFDEPPIGCCSSALWLLTSYDAVPVGGEVFNNTLEALLWNRSLRVEMSLDERMGDQERKKKGAVLRRYELLTSDVELDEDAKHVDTYWGGQAWLIATAQLARALALRGDVDEASDTLSLCLQTRDKDGHLPEQFLGTYHRRDFFDRWQGYTREPTPPPWLTWSHAEVLRAYTLLHRSA